MSLAEPATLTSDFSAPNQVALAWSASSSTNLLGWLVEQKLGSGQWTRHPILDPSVLKVVINELPAGEAAFRVWTVDNYLELETKGTVKPVSPPPPPPPPPGNIGTKAGYLGFGPGSWPPASWTPYSGSWKNGSVKSATAHPRSAQIATNIVSRFGTPRSLVAGRSSLGIEEWAHPLYFVQPTDPTITLNITGSHGNLAATQKVQVPHGAQPAKGSDGHILLVYPDGSCIEVWACKQISWTNPVLTGVNGNRTSITGTGWDGIATASHACLLAGIIRPEELATRINHPLFCVIKAGSELLDYGFGVVGPSGGDGSFIRPAVKGDAHTSGSNLPPMGARLRLRYTAAEIAALPVPAYRKRIVEALAVEGSYFGDTGGGGVGFQLLSGATYTSLGYADPLVSLAQKEGVPKNSDGTYTFNVSSGVDWSRLEVVLPPT